MTRACSAQPRLQELALKGSPLVRPREGSYKRMHVLPVTPLEQNWCGSEAWLLAKIMKYGRMHTQRLLQQVSDSIFQKLAEVYLNQTAGRASARKAPRESTSSSASGRAMTSVPPCVSGAHTSSTAA